MGDMHPFAYYLHEDDSRSGSAALSYVRKPLRAALRRRGCMLVGSALSRAGRAKAGECVGCFTPHSESISTRPNVTRHIISPYSDASHSPALAPPALRSVPAYPRDQLRQPLSGVHPKHAFPSPPILGRDSCKTLALNPQSASKPIALMPLSSSHSISCEPLRVGTVSCQQDRRSGRLVSGRLCINARIISVAFPESSRRQAALRRGRSTGSDHVRQGRRRLPL